MAEREHEHDAGAEADDLPEPWRLVSSRSGPDLILFRARWDKMTNPRTGRDFDRLVLETREWVNIVAFTPERQLVLVRQFRFGSGEVSTEIPGGVVDPGELHAATARRELREETGFTSDTWTYLGAVQPNPAFHDNLCHHWLAEDCRRVHDQLELDEGEDIRVVLLDEEAVAREVRAGRIAHSLVLSALSCVMDLRRRP